MGLRKEVRMRRKDKQMEQAEAEALLREATVVHLGLVDADGTPYVVPLNYGYRDGALYLHGAAEGRKIDLLRRGGLVGFCVAIDDGVVGPAGPSACSFGSHYRSVIGTGRAVFLETPEARRDGLDVLMARYMEGRPVYSQPLLEEVAVIRIDIESITGKQSGRRPTDAEPVS